MSGAWRWYHGGGSDALDHVRSVGRENQYEPDQSPNPMPEGRGRAVLAGAVHVQDGDPLSILLACEAADEDEGCQCGAHLEEYLAAQSSTSRTRSTS